MRCPNCGAEVTTAFCSYCGTEMQRQPVHITNNYYGAPTNAQAPVRSARVSAVSCPNCGSNRVSFERETSGMRGYHKTVGVCRDCGNTWVTAADAYAPPSQMVSPKSKGVAFVLCLFLGMIGAHQFYAGKIGVGILYLFTAGLFGIGWLIDIIQILTGNFRDSNGLPMK